MPRGDRTDPMGFGAMTGRGAGFCAGYRVAAHMNPFFGRGCYLPRCGFRGGGSGRGWRNWFWATGLTGWQRHAMFLPAFSGWGNPYWFPFGEMTPEQEADILRSQAELLKSEMEDIQSRIEALEKLRSEHEEKDQ
ncbi:MAG: DUF5320 domain-containing protein [bacterium]